MRRRLVFVLAVLGVVLVFAGTATAGRISGRYIVVLKPGVNPRAEARHAGAEIFYTYRSAINGYAARLSPAALARARADSRVLLVSPDRTVHAVAQTLP